MQQEGGAAPFGGVRHDLDRIAGAGGERPQPGQVAVSVADLPLSAIGDFILWPYTAVFTYVNRPFMTEMQTIETNQAVQLPMAPAPLVTPMKLP